ncbi:MAG: pyridoxal 5-phosphate synthase glutaminase subunit PdxT [Actinomycetota bacterium]|jgi:5'-phosphate synthase pdxT subunit
MKTIGVLAFQGDVREHLAAVEAAGARAIEVRTEAELAAIDGLILPGGESTTISKLARIFELFDPIKTAIAAGLPIFGTCAGLILLADRILDGIEGQETFGGLDVTVRRNAFGHQTESFETEISFKGIEGADLVAAFIRAPIIEQVGQGAEVLATLDSGAVVAVRQKSLLGISFHPEVTDEDRVHKYFIESMVSA